MKLNRRHLLGLVAASPALVLLGRPVLAATPQVYQTDGVAVDGSDVVAYFTQGAPVAGSAELQHDWNGATWYFSSAQTRAAFAAAPETYAPQYGGYCAYVVSEGGIASTIPEAWKIVDGKLYLNYSRRFHRKWERDIPGRIAAADANWPDVLAG